MSECVNALVAKFAGFRDSVTRALDALSAKLDERGRTPWGHIWSAMGVMLTILVTVGGLALLPMKDGQARLEAALEKFSEHVVSEKEFATFIGNTKGRRDDQQRATEDRFRRAEADLDHLQAAIVPRGEHDAHWADQPSRDTEIQRQVDDLRGRVGRNQQPQGQDPVHGAPHRGPRSRSGTAMNQSYRSVALVSYTAFSAAIPANTRTCTINASAATGA